VDGEIGFAEARVSVQVKCTSTRKIRGRSISWPVKTEWVNNWQQCRLPVYFVIVIVPAEPAAWIEHDPADGTFHRTAAYWRRIRRDERIGSRISIPKGQRLQASTLGLWHSDLLEIFNPSGGGT